MANHSTRPPADSSTPDASTSIDPPKSPTGLPPITLPKIRSRTASHTLSSSSTTPGGGASSRKAPSAVGTTQETHSEKVSISMPPPATKFARSRTSSEYSLGGAQSTETWRQGVTSNPTNSLSGRPSKDDFAMDDSDTPRLSYNTMADDHRHALLPDPALKSPPNELEPKRQSVSSIYSLSSARAGGNGGGVSSSAASANGSEAGSGGPIPISKTTSGNLATNKGPGTSQAETSTSPVMITTSSTPTSLTGGTSSNYQLTPRETPAQAAELAKRNAEKRGEAPRVDGVPRPQPPARDRSRPKRRFSGSTGASSHSPSSERGLLKKEEPKKQSLGIIGVCALDVKARSKPSRNILSRLIEQGEFEVVVFGDKVILDEEIENWPICNFLISFYSDGFPLDKAIAYVKARKPFCVNDVPMQKILWDRRICLRILDKINVPTPKRLEVNRDGGPSILTASMAKHLKDTTGVVLEGPEDGTGGQMAPPRVVELLDGNTLSVDGTLLTKPFVEKPVSGEDHNVCIYFPNGGGARRLFRKIGNKSSEHVEDLTIPRAITEPAGSFIYEKFLHVENAEDVKAYTVGENYCHAETRKSPVVDGLVRRNTHGKEIRYKIALKDHETEIASRIAKTFGQRVCGFDLLRSGGKSYVIDVNGWSFVKDNEDYYDKAAKILKALFIHEKERQLGIPHPPVPISTTSDKKDLKSKDSKDAIDKESSHRSVLSFVHRSPSIPKLHLHHYKTPVETPVVSGNPTPRGSPPGLNRVRDVSVSSLPPAALLPPPAAVSLATASTPHISSPAVADSLTAEVENDSSVDVPPPAPKHTWKMKGLVSVIRHADRTPKQKYKFTFHTEPFIRLLRGHQEEVLLTGEAALESVIEAVDEAMVEGVEDQEKLRQLRNVLAKKGGWAGTKVQIKPMFTKKKVPKLDFDPRNPKKAKSPKIPTADFANTSDSNGVESSARRIPTRDDSVSDTTLSRITAAENSLVVEKLQLIVKWGGEPTHSARYQAQELGETMRNDLNLMNKEVLSEVHVFSSSERRVTTSAQIFASAFTKQKELPADFITVRKDLLDDSNAAKDEMDKVKKKLKTLMREGEEAPPQYAWPPNMVEPSIVQKYLVQLMKFHRKVMRQNFSKLYGGASTSLNSIANPGDKTLDPMSMASVASPLSQATVTSNIQSRWCCGEDAELFKERWEKLFSEFCDSEKVDPSKVSELYDTMKFDALHNRQFLEWVFTPSKSILEEEEKKILAAESMPELKGVSKEKRKDQKDSDSASSSSPPDRDSSSLGSSVVRDPPPRSMHRRIFRRKSVVEPVQTEQLPENYFKLKGGNGQTKAMTDERLEKLRELYKLAKILFDFICPQEYGMTDSEKLEIGLLTSLPLLKEVVQDLEEMQASDEAKSFIYFTKESHVYTLLNCILEGGIDTRIARSAIPELDYLSQICFELYESENRTPKHAMGEGEVPTYAYSIRISISPGCHTFDPLDVQLDSKHCISCAPRRSLTSHGDWKEVIETLRAKFHQVKLPKSFLAVNLSETHTFHKKEEQDDSNANPTIKPESAIIQEIVVKETALYMKVDEQTDAVSVDGAKNESGEDAV